MKLRILTVEEEMSCLECEITGKNKCDYPGCEKCFGQIPALEWHKSGACFNPPSPYGPCERSKINSNKCDVALHYDSITKCYKCNRWVSIVEVYYKKILP